MSMIRLKDLLSETVSGDGGTNKRGVTETVSGDVGTNKRGVTETVSNTVDVGARFGDWTVDRIQSAKDAMGLDRGGVITLKHNVKGDILPVTYDSGQWKVTLHQHVMTDATALGLLNQIAKNNRI